MTIGQDQSSEECSGHEENQCYHRKDSVNNTIDCSKTFQENKEDGMGMLSPLNIKMNNDEGLKKRETKSHKKLNTLLFPKQIRPMIRHYIERRARYQNSIEINSLPITKYKLFLECMNHYKLKENVHATFKTWLTEFNNTVNFIDCRSKYGYCIKHLQIM